MARNRLACCYFPTTVIFLDDNINFIKNLSLQLKDGLAYRKFYEPYKLTQYLEHDYHPYVNPRQWLSDLKHHDDLGELEQDEFTHSFVDMDIFSIHKLIYVPDRFREISVVIADYSMPAMNGLEFCKAIEELPIKKIILTGQAGHNTAVKAFNEGIIDRFIMKGDENFLKLLHGSIHELQHQYFQVLSETIIRNLAANSQNCLGDPLFVDFFEKYRQDNKIVEYYLVKESGCFLMLTGKGEMSWLVVRNDRDMQEHYEIAEGNDAPKPIVQALKNKKEVLFLFTYEDEINISVSEWKDYMYPAKRLEGKYNDYYYAIIKGPSHYAIQAQKIVSYQDYLKKL